MKLARIATQRQGRQQGEEHIPSPLLLPTPHPFGKHCYHLNPIDHWQHWWKLGLFHDLYNLVVSVEGIDWVERQKEMLQIMHDKFGIMHTF